METYLDGLWFARLVFQRGLSAIYLLAFASALNQFRPLLGEHGLLPTPQLLQRSSFRQAPSLFHLHYSDRLFTALAWLGIALSCLALLGLSESGPLWLSFTVWLTLWLLYLSIVNVGQVFYGFGWESMLLEAGFFACFLGPSQLTPSFIPLLCLRWMLFRVELGAGLIKLRHDSCWRDLTCLYYHYETQPIPNPLSCHFHRLPKPLHRFSVGFSHFVQLVVPFGLFLPQPCALVAAGLMAGHQLLLIISGNYAWLNWLTIVLGASALSDAAVHDMLGLVAPQTVARSTAHELLLYALLGLTLCLSIAPLRNLFAKRQLMNHSYNALHLVNAYGAFGSVSRERYEVVLEGSTDTPFGDDADAAWRAYEFKAKPGDPRRRPRQCAPYHLRLDWLMWFLPFAVSVSEGGIFVLQRERWFVELVRRLLEGERATLALLQENPFPNAPPRLIRARFYRYRYADAAERKAGAYWARTLLGEYLPPVSLQTLPRHSS